ncbi:ModE family transcriptional regulator [Hydrogenovibrio sp. SC-1]|uniref:winged helix-turn-helix domain-containing protein n=1 Tax=Hydrogenovibrio sp. SC-1 TaxID=2065820 RepID=UPI000C7E5A7B|nr:winged helix-turn-helix domain-containing protein [Hydrogenovibrio sp. SC-1]PLA75061.1 ModE family transcriptional regulator [Hydrogenovibrio sp. SC-1]
MTSIAHITSDTKQTPSSKLPGEAYSERIRARFWLSDDSGSYVGIGRITLLEEIQKTGSINQAAKAMNMSYKKAWKLVDEMNQLLNQPLVIKAQGGKSGGGTILTQEGLWVLEQFRAIEQRLQKFLQHESCQFAQELNSLK